MYTIDSNIPIPPRRKYPFDDMQIGDSFLVMAFDGHRNRVRGAADAAQTRLGYKFTVRRQPDGGWRVWRTA